MNVLIVLVGVMLGAVLGLGAPDLTLQSPPGLWQQCSAQLRLA